MTLPYVGDVLWGSEIYYSLVIRAIALGLLPLRGVVLGLTTVGTLVGGARLWSSLAVRHCLMQWLCPADGQGQFLEQLAACAVRPKAEAGLLGGSKPLALIG